ncbi:SCO3374 family protein [Streptomyces sp. NBC_01142]|uniref:SCO3374 family protein n=1 Tax=Streptomyces sp. NBC_01142 TaxID=2975865 RepID=UPI002258CF7A|nr:SCO3374 family protein [Streptomyces sp. NBC_01142]MCX4818476.1 SCO3374 family protein [Streptomyces sp. NBC_01142]
MAFTVPLPRTPFDGGTAQWYENQLGWAAADGPPVQLLTGLRFDVLELPAEVGAAVLRRLDLSGPVALMGRRMRLLVAAGSAEELPGLLDWLEWGAIDLDLTAIGAGGRMTAPPPPGWPGSQGAAAWLRPPVPGREVEPTLPALAPLGNSAGYGGIPDFVRIVDTAATECHRVRLLRTNSPRARSANRAKSQPLAFS